jgi:hypothetical protein
MKINGLNGWPIRQKEAYCGNLVKRFTNFNSEGIDPNWPTRSIERLISTGSIPQTWKSLAQMG